MNELDEIRKRKLAQLQQQFAQQTDEQSELTSQIGMLEGYVKQHLSKEALERYGNIRSVDEKKALQICVLLGQVIKEQRVGIITDEQFKTVLEHLTQKKRETKITFR